jgi:hypothetical protein
MTTKCSSKIILLLRSSLPYVHLHLLGQVVGAAESSNNQPSPPTQSYLHLHSQKNIQGASFLPPECSPPRSNYYSAKIVLPKIRHLDHFISASEFLIHVQLLPLFLNLFQKPLQNPPIPFRPSPTYPPSFLPPSHQFSSTPCHHS